MIVDRIFTPSLSQVAYLVADEAAGLAVVIDPRRDVQAYRDWADERGLRISAILETHVHADFVSGGKELSELTGAPLYASRLGDQAFPHHPLDDGEDIAIGSLVLRAFWTPGHTPEHMSYLLFDLAQGDDPIAVFTGDALFVGDVGRPDLLGAARTGELVAQLYPTITQRFATLPDATLVYPGHTAGSSCGKKIVDAPDSTIGTERRTNYAFQPATAESFAEAVLGNMPPAPTYYPELKRVNKVGPADTASLPDGGPLSAAAVKALREDGALVVDARGPAAFGEGHIPGAIAVGWGPNFLAWMGWLAPYERDLVFVIDDPEQFADLRLELRRIGLDRVAGYLQGGMEAWHAAGYPAEMLEQASVSDLAARRAEPSPLPVLDVRGDDEWRQGHIGGAEHVFAGALAQGAEVPFGPDETFAVICGTGYRSSVAASLLQARGYTRLINIMGGMTAWSEAGFPVSA